MEIPAVHGYGFYFGPTTWARHARAFFNALHRQIPVRMHPLDRDRTYATLAEDEAALLSGNEGEHEGIGIGIGPMEKMQSVRGWHRIAFAVWETTKLPLDKRAQLQAMDEVWTPSKWGRDLLAANGLAAEKVFVVPEGVDTQRFVPQLRSREPRPFRFLCVGKWEVRKGVEELVQCFAETFAQDEDVELVVHAHNPWLPGFDAGKAVRCALAGKKARVRVSYPVSEPELAALYGTCDVFVLPTRAEGWGLPVVEAMACGLPVIVTNYSAPREFVNEAVGYPLGVTRMTQVRDPYFFPAPTDYGEWAEPDWDHLRVLLRWVAEHRDEAAEKGSRARQEVSAHWTWDHAAEIALRRLQQL